jgi:transposase-like protein
VPVGHEAVAVPKERRFSAQRKAEAAQRLMRGEAIDALSRELGVTAATLSEWRDRFLAGGEAALKSREHTAQDDEILRLKAMVGELAMRNELLGEKARLLEANHPSFPWRRSRG